MDRSMHNMTNLFAQLGLKNSNEDIEFFIAANRGLQKDQPLADADFWSNGQQQFLQEAIQLDSDWSEIVDSLDALLRE
ncbi:DUF2789 domain-containing protein [Colwellia sp. Arc7-635]|uniref:DUF2789 family protein n=1 Tax=Colwellia sp. Arc7-635 TaxID=2497879 RepID=UPI000F8539FE|nr:DUF2789 family protein [Colwellia sp. Arc7-635]AZQ84170.1 DUF2789 domain-containing protein [Colwellia sp. Arc7-635]